MTYTIPQFHQNLNLTITTRGGIIVLSPCGHWVENYTLRKIMRSLALMQKYRLHELSQTSFGIAIRIVRRGRAAQSTLAHVRTPEICSLTYVGSRGVFVRNTRITKQSKLPKGTTVGIVQSLVSVLPVTMPVDSKLTELIPDGTPVKPGSIIATYKTDLKQ